MIHILLLNKVLLELRSNLILGQGRFEFVLKNVHTPQGGREGPPVEISRPTLLNWITTKLNKNYTYVPQGI